MNIVRYGFIVLCLSGCTNQEVYNAVQTNQKNQCDQLSGIQRENCLKNLAPDYSTYERQRQQLLEQKQKKQ